MHLELNRNNAGPKHVSGKFGVSKLGIAQVINEQGQMGTVFFYHLTQSPLDVTLRMLIGKARSAGWRCYIKVPHEDALRQLDVALWKGEPTAFSAHNIVSEDGNSSILLGLENDQQGYECLFSAMGAEFPIDAIKVADRVCVLFDGHDQGAVEAARNQWKTMTGAGVSAQYWAQDDGRWVKKAEA